MARSRRLAIFLLEGKGSTKKRMRESIREVDPERVIETSVSL